MVRVRIMVRFKGWVWIRLSVGLGLGLGFGFGETNSSKRDSVNRQVTGSGLVVWICTGLGLLIH